MYFPDDKEYLFPLPVLIFAIKIAELGTNMLPWQAIQNMQRPEKSTCCFACSLITENRKQIKQLKCKEFSYFHNANFGRRQIIS